MNRFKLFSVLSLTFLLSSKLALASVDYSNDECCCGCCSVWSNPKVSSVNVYSSNSCYSPDNNYCVYSRAYSDSSTGSYSESNLFVENVKESRDVFEFANVVSFAFSKDSKYIMLERSEYSDQINAQNDYIEIFDMNAEKRIFYMPFIKKCYSSSYNNFKSYNLDNIVFLNFSGDTLKSIQWDFEGNYINVPAYVYNVSSVYVSQLGLGVSVKFNNGKVSVYLPKKDFSGLGLLAEFERSISVNN